MNRDEALKNIEASVTQLHEAIGQGRSEELEQYLTVMSRFHHYSFGNTLMIMAQRPDATRVAGFHKWKELGRHVKKGEKGIAILAPCRYKAKVEDEATGTELEVPVIRGFKVVYVFDVTSTEGKELPEFATVSGEPGENLLRIEHVIRSAEIELEYRPLPPGVLGCFGDGKICIRPELSPAERFSVAVHELAHARLHQGERRHETTKKVRETEAEAVAFVVSNVFGLDSSAKSRDYIQLYRGTPETLSESLDFIQKTASWIIESLNNVEFPDTIADVAEQEAA